MYTDTYMQNYSTDKTDKKCRNTEQHLLTTLEKNKIKSLPLICMTYTQPQRFLNEQ